MKSHEPKSIARRLTAMLVIGSLVTSGYFVGKQKGGILWSLAARAASLSAMSLMPEGGKQVLSDKITAAARDDNDTAGMYDTAELHEIMSSSAASSADSSFASSAPSPPADKDTGLIQTTQLSVKGANLSYGNVHISNKTQKHTVDIKGILNSEPAVKLTLGSEPEVLIVHTHTTEAYQKEDTGYYIKSENTRSTDTSVNVARVGEEIEKQLTAAGISVIHDKTLHDHPSYNGSYENAAKTIQSYLKKYPSIKVVIDGHRDAITREDQTKVKPTVEINGKKAAQVMIVAGCQEGSVYGFDSWQENLKLTVRLQNVMETDYPGLARPMLFTARRYNQQLTKGSVLLEIGSEANTLQEAIYSGELIGKALGKILAG